MTWELMIISNLSLLLLGLGTVFFLRNRQLAQANEALGEAQSELNDKLAAAEQQVVQLQGELAGAQGEQSKLSEQLKALEEELEAAKAAAGSAQEELVAEFGADSPEEVRKLLRRFTQESRDLHARVQELEAENASLKGETVDDTAQSPADGTPPEPQPDAEATEEEAAPSSTHDAPADDSSVDNDAATAAEEDRAEANGDSEEQAS